MKKQTRLPLFRVLCLATAMAAITFTSCKHEEKESGPVNSSDSLQNDKMKNVEVTTLSPRTFNHYVDIQGKVDADENISVNAEMPGTVSKINVQLGDAVNAGQVLAELDSRVIQQGIAEVQEGLELATIMYEKQKNLWDQKIGTEVQYLTAKTQKESLEKRMASMQEQLRMTKIVTPISGIVDAVDIKLGQATAPGMPALRVVNMNSLKVKGEVAESYIGKVKAGNSVVVILPDLNDTIVTKISYVAKVISPLNRTFTITINLDKGHEYHPNQIAIVKIIDYTNPSAFVIPVNAIQHSGEGDFTFICEGNKAHKVRVKTGRTYNGWTEITEGLKQGDRFISRGFQELNENEEVKIQNVN